MNSTNTLEVVKQETINSVMIDILKGVQTAGGEIYGASKVGIAKAVEFAQAEAPIVVQEFLTWKFWEAVLNFSSLMILPLIVIITWVFIWKWSKSFCHKEDMEITRGLSFLFGGLGLLFFLLAADIAGPIKTMFQIKLAPRVYLIEYVSKTITK